MIKGIWGSTLKQSKTWQLMLSSTLLFLVSCNDITQVESTGRGRDSLSFQGSGESYIYEDSPSVIANNEYLVYPNFSDYVTAKFVTDTNYLQKPCSINQYLTTTSSFTDTTSADCFLVLNDKQVTTQAIQSKSGGWDYGIESDEFYQINTFYHMNKLVERFYSSLSFSHKEVHLNSPMSIPPATKYNFIDTKSYWLTRSGVNATLKAYAKCELDQLNAYFSPADNELCFGWNSAKSHLRMVQDPSIIYHELGHVLVKVMMNQRNITSGKDPSTFNPHFHAHAFESDLGSVFYDEAGSINEGIADFFSYYMNQRTHFGEWGLGKNFTSNGISASRPLTETDSRHTASVSKNPGERLSYPQYLHYDPNDSKTNYEDVHVSGQIITHYLVSLTEEFKNSCSFSNTSTTGIHNEATDYVVLLLNETLAEVGDLTAKGSDLFSEYATLNAAQKDVFFTNLNDTESYLWTQVVNPPNFRRFFRIFGKNIIHYISGHLCPGFTVDESETLLDEYGLLLFKSYEDRGNGINASNFLAMNFFNFSGSQLFAARPLLPLFLNTEVNENNRRNTVLVSKDLIQLSEDSQIFLFDGQQEIQNTLSALTFAGQNVTTTEGIAGVEYNNNNIKISPGEVVAIAPNILNKSNSTIAGVQVLANDWDHMKLIQPSDPLYSDADLSNDPSYSYINRTKNINGIKNNDIAGYVASHSPCSFDDFPSSSEGGVTDTTSTTEGSCSFTSRNNYNLDLTETVSSIIYPKYKKDAPQPICMVQFSDENETKWVAQDFYRFYQLGIEDKDCLNNPSMSGDDFNPNECLIRFLPGASQAIYGKISPQKTWTETMKENTDQSVSFRGASNTMIMEVNKWIQPGTRFNCRMRVRFSNCSNCFNNDNTGDDYPDFQYGGASAYKTLNFQFTVLD